MTIGKRVIFAWPASSYELLDALRAMFPTLRFGMLETGRVNTIIFEGSDDDKDAVSLFRHGFEAGWKRGVASQRRPE